MDNNKVKIEKYQAIPDHKLSTEIRPIVDHFDDAINVKKTFEFRNLYAIITNFRR